MQNLNNIVLSINFEERTGKKAVNTSDTFKVWVSTIFNQDIYETTLVTDLSFVKESNYEFTVTADNSGINKIEAILQDKPKTKTVTSNTLIAIID